MSNPIPNLPPAAKAILQKAIATGPAPTGRTDAGGSYHIPVHNSGHGQPNFPPDVTYNPNPNTDVPYSTHSKAVAKALAVDRTGNTGGR